MGAVHDYGERKREEGYKEGYKEGYEIGYKIGYNSFATYMIEKGKCNEEIQKETGLPLEEIKKIRKYLKLYNN